MKHAVIVAHPNAGSLNCAIARTYAAAVVELGHTGIVRDLYRMRFDPCLRSSEIPGPRGVSVGADVAAERALLADCAVFAFIYPLWFNTPPAILKGYVDRVFGYGFGYEAAMHGTDPLLTGRRLISFTTSGAPASWVRDTGALKALSTVFDAHVAAMCGMTLVDHVHTGGVTSGVTAEAVSRILDDVSGAVRRAFAGEGVAAWT